MTNFELLQTNSKEQYDAAMSSVEDLTKSAQTIAKAQADYVKKFFDHGAGYFEELVKLKSLDQIIELNTAHANHTRVVSRRVEKARRAVW